MVIRSTGFFFAGLMFLLTAAPLHALEFEGFGSVSYHKHEVKGEHASGSMEYPEGFTLGGFNLYAFQEIADGTSAFAEFIIGDYTEAIEMERLWIRRVFSPSFEFKAGLIESPLGYWNRTYHQGGQLLQDTISRPFFLNYEDQDGAIFPMVTVGFEMGGTARVRGGELDYVMIFGNGVSLDTGASSHDAGALHGAGSSEIGINLLGDPGDEKLFILRTAYRFSGIPLQIGLFGMNNPVVESGEGAGVKGTFGEELISQTVVGADVHFSRNGFEAIAEYYHIDNDDVIGKADVDPASGYYIQLGYRLTERLKPIYRYVNLDFDEADPYFQYLGVQQQYHHIVGLRYDLDESNALKFEVHQMNFNNKTEYHSTLQWAFLMF